VVLVKFIFFTDFFVVLALVLAKKFIGFSKGFSDCFYKCAIIVCVFRCSLKPKNGARDVRQDVYKHMILLIC